MPTVWTLFLNLYLINKLDFSFCLPNFSLIKPSLSFSFKKLTKFEKKIEKKGNQELTEEAMNGEA